MAPQITVVSPERIAAEMQSMLVDANRGPAVRLFLESGLAAAVLPEIVAEVARDPRTEETLRVLERLDGPGFPLALAALLARWTDAAGAQEIGRRWRLSNQHTDRVAWLLAHRDALREVRGKPWSALYPILVAEGTEDLLSLGEAEARAGYRDPQELAWCRTLLEQPREVIDPAPLLTGEDLKRLGVPPGPIYRVVLDRARGAQLDGLVRTKDESLQLAERILRETEEP
jgi:tRNA nucleotidyltransferase/poly(A) polymerase